MREVRLHFKCPFHAALIAEVRFPHRVLVPVVVIEGEVSQIVLVALSHEGLVFLANKQRRNIYAVGVHALQEMPHPVVVVVHVQVLEALLLLSESGDIFAHLTRV